MCFDDVLFVAKNTILWFTEMAQNIKAEMSLLFNHMKLASGVLQCTCWANDVYICN
jgi:hypothetical protein